MGPSRVSIARIARTAYAPMAVTKFSLIAIVGTKGSLQFVEPFGQFDIGAPGIGHERDRDAQARHLAVGHCELEPIRLPRFREGFQIMDLEPDDIARAALG